MNQFSRRNWWIPLFAAKALMAAPDTFGVATGQLGETAWEFVATANQDGGDFSVNGYLTAIGGLPEAVLFTDPVTRSQATARFTVTASLQLVSRNVLGVMFVLDEAGTFTVSYSETASATAAAIASGSISVQSSIQVTTQFTSEESPGKGNFRATGELVRTATQIFTLDGVPHEFGDASQAWLMTAAGAGTLTDPNAPVAQIVLGGSVAVGPKRAVPRR